MDEQKIFNESDLIDMMFDDVDIGVFKALFEKDKDPKKWSTLLHMCYWERSYERVGGDLGYLENPPINEERLKYLDELIAFLEGAGIEAVNNAPRV